MKRTYLTLIAALLLMALPAHAQLVSTVTTITHDSTFSKGRDFWFAMQSNYWGIDLGGKYMRIYITSDVDCTAFVTTSEATTPVLVRAHQISSFLIPEFSEMESSGVPENKVIRVSCPTADLTVYDMSHNDYTSDGSYIIPTIGWGTDYVVAAYGSLFEGGTGYGFDLPSTCMVVANQDNTTFSITPSCDCRQCTGGNDNGDANSRIVVFPAGQPQNFQLNRGQCIQFMPVFAQADSGFDMTGTIIHSNQPVGVEGGSVCPQIPGTFSYCDHAEDMIPPVRTWGETYYATNPIQSDTMPSHNAAEYLFIASQAGQTIFRQSCDSGIHSECIIPNQYGIFWDELSGPQKLTSAAPFFVVEYINSSSYPDGLNGLGNPAEAIVIPREQYTKSVTFETPLSVGNIIPYTNYVNIIVHTNDENKTLLDGKNIGGDPKQCLDSNWEVFTVDSISSGTHTVTGDDSGVGVWIYGYGYDEAYAWSGPAQCKTFESPDLIAPRATISAECLEAFVHISDSGAGASKLDMIRLDSVSNMNFTIDPNWIEGSETDTSGYSMSIVNPTNPAVLIVSVFDCAGNHTTITTILAPAAATMRPPLQNLGVWTASKLANIAYDTLYSFGNGASDVSELHLLKGNVGFSLFDSIGGPLDLSPLLSGQRRLIQIQFEAVDSFPVIDSIIYGNSCNEQSVALLGSGGATDFFVTSQSWPYSLLPSLPVCYPKTVTIYNFSKDSLTIDKVFWKDGLHFKAVSTFPVKIPPAPASVPFIIDYCPDSNSFIRPDGTQGSWTSPQVVEGSVEVPHLDSLTGFAAGSSTNFVGSQTISASCAPPDDTLTVTLTITATGTGPSDVARISQSDPADFFNFIGTLPNGITWSPATTEQDIPPGQTVTLSLQYRVPVNQDVHIVDTITAFDENGDTIGGHPVTVTINANYIQGMINPPQLTFGPELFQSPPVTKTFTIASANALPFVVNEIWPPSTASFDINLPAGDTLPDTLQPGQMLPVNVTFNDSVDSSPVQTLTIYIYSNACEATQYEVTANILGSGVSETAQPSLNAAILPAIDGHSLEIILPTDIVGPINFQLVNVLGESVLRFTFNMGTQNIDASSLPRGVYFYRLTSGQMNQSGKVILGE